MEGKWCLPPSTFRQNLDVKGRRGKAMTIMTVSWNLGESYFRAELLTVKASA